MDEEETPDTEKPVMVRGRILELRRRSEWAQNWGLGTLRYQPEGKKSFQNVAIVGPIGTLRLGDNVEVIGVFHQHPRYGAQLKILEAAIIFDDPKEMLKTWLAENLDHLGDVRSNALLEIYGAEGLIDLLNSPNAKDTVERLCVINGITEFRAAELLEAWGMRKAKFELFKQLSDVGLSASEIKDALEMGVDPNTLRTDPFTLYYRKVLSAERMEATLERHFPDLVGTNGHFMVLAHAATIRLCDDGDTAVRVEDVVDKIGELFDLDTDKDNLLELVKAIPHKLDMREGFLVPFEYARAENSIANFVREALGHATGD